MKAIEISLEGNIKEVDINLQILYDIYELYSPRTNLHFPICLAAKTFTEYEEGEDIKENKKANEIFKRNDLTGNIYIFLDGEEEPDKDEEEEVEEEEVAVINPYWTYENLLQDIINNNLVF